MEENIPFLPPTISWAPGDEGPPFYEWQQVYPFLQPLLDAQGTIWAEAQGANRWHDWPEDLYDPTEGHVWKVVPFLHTFPASDPAASVWVDRAVSACPRTAALLRRIPGLRTALFSRMGPNTALSAHTGWAELSIHVLRVHLPLDVPPGEGVCGMIVDDEIRHHKLGDLIVFDDSHLHTAFNNHATASRTVLIFDIVRPEGAPPGTATGGTTEELAAFMAYFK